MDHGEATAEKSITDIFNSMEYEEKKAKYGAGNPESFLIHGMELPDNLCHMLEGMTVKEPKSLDSALEAAVKAQTQWKSTSALTRANFLHKVWKALNSKLQSVSKLSICIQNGISSLVDYFDYYSDLILQTEEHKSWKPIGVVLVVLPNYSPFIILGGTVPGALAAGCSVIVLAKDQTQLLALYLQEIMLGEGLPEGLFNVVTKSGDIDKPLPQKINKVICCGSYSTAQKFYTKSLSKSFNFLCPNNTTALILESCDLSAAADKIFSETWGSNSWNMWSVSTVVVQEAVCEKFLEKLKFRMKQFTMENKNCLKFKNKILLEKVNKVILDATQAGAQVENYCNIENEWSPTIIVNYQDQLVDPDVPILKVLICRTAKEGVALLNNCYYNLGTSIWTEISSQAMEVASKLICSNVWINCHGITRASVPFQPSGSSGNCTFGGHDGLLEYMSFRHDDPVEGIKNDEDSKSSPEKVMVLQMGTSAQAAFIKWHTIKNKRKYFKDIANDKELSKQSEIISSCAHYGNISFSESNSDGEFFVVHNKAPLGVIVLFVNTPNADVASIASIITPAIAMGNAIIIVLQADYLAIMSLVKHFNRYLPKNLLSLIVGTKAVTDLASDPTVQALWLYDESSISVDFLQTIKTNSSRNLKNIWVIPKNVPTSQHLFGKKSLRNTVVWLPKIDQFP